MIRAGDMVVITAFARRDEADGRVALRVDTEIGEGGSTACFGLPVRLARVIKRAAPAPDRE